MNVDHTRLDLHRWQESPVQEHVIDEFVSGGLSRRAFIRKATMVGIGMSSIGAILGACGSNTPGSGPTGGSGKSGATIRAGQLVPTTAINPLLVSGGGGYLALGLCGEWLTLVDEHFNVQPWLAESWVPNSDGSAWTFKIRQGVKFNDGTPMTVDDVVYTFKQHANPKAGATAATVFGGVLTPDGVEKVDDTHVRFNLESPVGAWPSVGVSQTNYTVCIVPNNFDFTTYESHFPGTGRFKMVNYSRNVGGSFVPNPFYWGTPAKPAKLEVTYYSSEAPLTSALAAGAVDVNDLFSVSGSPQLLNGDFNVVSQRSSEHHELSMRCDTGPFANKLVRQAMALTLNRPQIVQALFKGHAQIGNDSPFAPAFPSSETNIPQRVQDIAKAKELMAEAGVPRGFSAQLATFNGFEAQYAQIIKESAAAIGIDINLSVTTGPVYYGSSKFGSSPWLDSTMSFLRDAPRGVPNVYLQANLQTINAQTGAGAWNAAHFSDPQYDALSKQYIAAVDLSAQKKLAGQIQTLLLDQTPIIVADFFDNLTAMRKNVQGVYPVPLNVFYWNMTKS